MILGGPFFNGANSVKKEYDLKRIGDLFTEYKNKKFADYPLTPNGKDANQLIEGYLYNIEIFAKFEWKALKDKLIKGGWTEANAAGKMKLQWQTVFQARRDDVFNAIWNNNNLKQELFSNAPNPTIAKEILDGLIDTLDDKLYKFIKIQ